MGGLSAWEDKMRLMSSENEEGGEGRASRRGIDNCVGWWGK